MDVMHWFESIRTPFLDAFFGFWSFFGEEYFMLAALCIMYWCVSKRMAYRVGFAAFISGCTAQSMKIICRVPRPWIADPTLNPLPSALETATGYSFPSGHTQTAAAVFGAVGVHIKKAVSWIICIIVPVMVAVSRMYLGVHTLADVLTALGVTAVIVAICALLPLDEPNRKKDAVLAIVLAALSLLSLAIALILEKTAAITAEMAADCCKFAAAGLGFALSFYIERSYICFSEKASFWRQVLKLVAGLAGVIIIKEGLKFVIGDSLAADFARYFLMAVWGLGLYPLLIKKWFNRKEAGGST